MKTRTKFAIASLSCTALIIGAALLVLKLGTSNDKDSEFEF